MLSQLLDDYGLVHKLILPYITALLNTPNPPTIENTMPAFLNECQFIGYLGGNLGTRLESAILMSPVEKVRRRYGLSSLPPGF